MRPNRILALASALVAAGCTLSSTADEWHDRIGPNGKPIYVKLHTNIGLNLAIIIPFLGHTSLREQIDAVTSEIASEDGDRIRMVESSSENYWYGFAPFTWIVTPVITTVAAEYEPTPEAFARDREQREREGA